MSGFLDEQSAEDHFRKAFSNVILSSVKEASIPVYVITKDGRGLSQKGEEYIQKLLFEEYGADNELHFLMGRAYNDPETYLNGLDKRPDSYTIVTVSHTHEFLVLPPSENAALISIVRENMIHCDSKNTWDILCNICE